jgi:hypothetical protein
MVICAIIKRNEGRTAPPPAYRLRRWRVPSAVPPTTHGLKYSLFYGRPGVREVGYDNERGKGDHRHFQGAETPYTFSTVEQLMADFWSDVRALRGSK